MRLYLISLLVALISLMAINYKEDMNGAVNLF